MTWCHCAGNVQTGLYSGKKMENSLALQAWPKDIHRRCGGVAVLQTVPYTSNGNRKLRRKGSVADCGTLFYIAYSIQAGSGRSTTMVAVCCSGHVNKRFIDWLNLILNFVIHSFHTFYGLLYCEMARGRRDQATYIHEEKAASPGGDVTASIIPERPAAAAAARAPQRSR